MAPGHHSTRYDVYLTFGCETPPDLSGLDGQIAALNDAALRARLLRRSPGPGFLGLGADQATARALLARLRAAGAHGEVIDAAYRQPRLTRDAARAIAERALPPHAAASFPGYPFNPVTLRREEPRWYLFSMISPRLVSEFHVPGGVLAYIDKLDGHVWNNDEIRALATTR